MIVLTVLIISKECCKEFNSRTTMLFLLMVVIVQSYFNNCRLPLCGSHTGALRFHVDPLVRKGKTETSWTSGTCIWNNSKRVKKPARLSEISLRKRENRQTGASQSKVYKDQWPSDQIIKFNENPVSSCHIRPFWASFILLTSASNLHLLHNTGKEYVHNENVDIRIRLGRTCQML